MTALAIDKRCTDMGRITLVSCLFMGLSHIIFLKQYVKGLLFALVEMIFITQIPAVVQKVQNLISLGNVPGNEGNVQKLHSIFMLIDGVIVLAVVALFLLAYFISVKSARAAYKTSCAAGNLTENRKILAGMAEKAFPLTALTPAVVLLVFFVMVPLLFSALVAFTNYSMPQHIPPKNLSQWVGFENFAAMFGGDATWTGALGRVALWTLVWALLATFTCYAGGMVMAVLLHDRRIRLAPVFRAIFILPYAVPGVVSMLVWKNLLNGSFGTINKTLLQLGIIGKMSDIPWLSDPMLARATLIVINLWAGFPYFMMLTTGAMTAISEHIFEAAAIDGASRFQVFRHVTLPTVVYQTLPLIIMSFTHNINNFGAIFFLTGGNPVAPDSTTTSAFATDIIVTWIYKLTITLQKYNFASVLAIMVFLILAPFAIFNFVRTKAFKEGDL